MINVRVSMFDESSVSCRPIDNPETGEKMFLLEIGDLGIVGKAEKVAEIALETMRVVRIATGKEFKFCDCCEKVVDTKELKKISGTDELVCQNCYEFEVEKCDRCKKEFLISEMYSIARDSNYQDYRFCCDECVSRRPLTQEEIEQIKAERALRERGVI